MGFEFNKPWVDFAVTGVGGKEVSEEDVDDEIADGGRVGPLLTELVTRFSDQVVFNLNICNKLCDYL